MAITHEILVLADQPQLRSELTIAFQALGELVPRHRFVEDRSQLFEAVRMRNPELVLVEFGEHPREMISLARELSTSSPPVPIAAIFRPNGFGDDVSESNVIIDAMRAGVRDFLRRPISTNELRRLVEQLAAPGRQNPELQSPANGCVVAFISNKGGVGKSTLAVNTAVWLARKRAGRVLLVDASLQMGVAAALLDLTPTATLTDLARERERLDVTMIRQLASPHRSGLHLLAAPGDAVEAMEVDDLLMTRLLSLARQAYDFILVDTFPMFDRVVMATLDLSDRAYIVVENVLPTLLGAAKLLGVLDKIGFPVERQSLVVNRAQRVAGTLSLGDIASRLNRPIDHVLAYDKRVLAAANTGEPVAMRTFWFGGFSRGVTDLAAHVEELGERRRTESNGRDHNLILGRHADAAMPSPLAEATREEQK
jgi:pilus assembly protein CpaE